MGRGYDVIKLQYQKQSLKIRYLLHSFSMDSYILRAWEPESRMHMEAEGKLEKRISFLTFLLQENCSHGQFKTANIIKP